MAPDLSAWGTATGLAPVPVGARRHTFRAFLDGRAVVAKSGAPGEPSLRWQLRAEAAARRAGLVTPGLIPTGTGALASRGWTVEPWLDGRTGTAADLAALPLAAFHRAARVLPERPGLRPRLPPGWHRLARLPGPRGGIHGDLHPGNLLRLPSGRLALLDWEEARRDAQAIDHAARRPGSADHARAELAACARAEPARAGMMARRLLMWSSGPTHDVGLALSGA